jgi:hypothetical protein
LFAARTIEDSSERFVTDNLVNADRLAIDLLSAPLEDMNEGDAVAVKIHELANTHGAEPVRQQIIKALPAGTSLDTSPDHVIWSLTNAWMDAGFYLRLCVGYRVAAGLPGRR